MLAHDYLTQRGGAERVVLHFLAAFPSAPLYTSLFEPSTTFPEFGDVEVRPGPLNKVALLRHHHRLSLPFQAAAWTRTRITGADAVLASSSGWAHGVTCDVPKVVYCHNPARWLYQTDQYLGSGRRSLTGVALSALKRPLERWDRKAAASAQRYLCQSTVVRRRIETVYGIEAEVIPAPAGVDPDGEQRPPSGERSTQPGFFLCVSRLMTYKNVHAIVEAFAQLPDERLVVVGDGPQRQQLTQVAGSNVQLVGSIDDAELRWHYANCAAIIAASYEDYGLTPIEALVFGKPSIVLEWGGFLDTVMPGESGVFFPEPKAPDIVRGGRVPVPGMGRRDARPSCRALLPQAFARRLQAIMDETIRQA